MKASARWHRIYRVHGWRAAVRPAAALCTILGASLALATFAVGISDDASTRLMFSLALAAAAITITGLINYRAADARTAWRRGFRLGCRVGMLAQRESLRTDGIALSNRPSQLSVHAVPPTAGEALTPEAAAPPPA